MYPGCSWLSLFLFSYLCDSSLCCPVCSVVETRDGFKSIISLKRKEAFHFLQTTVKNAFLMSSLCPVFLIFLVFLLYHDAKHTANRSKMHYGAAGWFLIWFGFFLWELVRHCRSAWGRYKRPNPPLRLLSHSCSFFFLPATWHLCSEDFRLVSPHAMCWLFTFLPYIK